MALIKNEVTDVDREFCRALHDSHGTANNPLIYNLIKDHNCTAEDVFLIAKKTKNEDFLDNTLARYSQSDYAVARRLNKIAQSKTAENWRTFRDYSWYFKNVPEEYKDYNITEQLQTVGFFKSDKVVDHRTLSLYVYNYGMSLINGENYPSDFFVERFKTNKTLYETWAEPYKMKDIAISYDGTVATIRNYSRPFSRWMDSYMNYCRYDYDRDDGNTQLTGTVQRRVVEQMTQVALLGEIMKNEAYTQEELSTSNVYSYNDYIFNTSRKTGTSKYNHPQKIRLEMFGQAKALEMLLCMGLGFKMKTNSNWDLKVSNKKVLKRIQTAYKTFIKAKTVDDRKAMRKLLKDQLTIIINDFMRNIMEVVELNCVEKQDEMFEQGHKAKTVSRARTVTVAPTNGEPLVHRKFDLSKLATATTTVVEKGRH